MPLIQDLSAVVGKADVLVGDEVALRPSHWRAESPCEAICIVRPQSVGQVSRILQLCHEKNQPVVTHGGGTGLVRGSVATSSEVVLSLERMNRIEEVSSADSTAIVQAGVPLQAVQEGAREEGFVFPFDFGARGTATIGGAIATNAGGNRVIRYGMTRNLVLGLEAVLADGTVLSSLNRMLKNNAGYDLKQLFIGSEGTLGIVTRAVLRIFPRPASENLALVAVPEFKDLPVLLNRLHRDLAGTLSAFEVMWKSFYDLVTIDVGKPAPLPSGYPFYVLIEALGSEQEADAERFESTLFSAQKDGLILDGVTGMSTREKEEIWSIRDGIGEFGGLGAMFTFDIGLPIRDMQDYVDRVTRSVRSTWPRARIITFGHLGDGNLHFGIGVGSGDPAIRARVESMVYAPLTEIGGSISAEHGIGLDKRDYLPISRTKAEIRTMRLLKQTLDPRSILNPGRVLRLAESG